MRHPGVGRGPFLFHVLAINSERMWLCSRLRAAFLGYAGYGGLGRRGPGSGLAEAWQALLVVGAVRLVPSLQVGRRRRAVRAGPAPHIPRFNERLPLGVLAVGPGLPARPGRGGAPLLRQGRAARLTPGSQAGPGGQLLPGWGLPRPRCAPLMAGAGWEGGGHPSWALTPLPRGLDGCR